MPASSVPDYNPFSTVGAGLSLGALKMLHGLPSTGDEVGIDGCLVLVGAFFDRDPLLGSGLSDGHQHEHGLAPGAGEIVEMSKSRVLEDLVSCRRRLG